MIVFGYLIYQAFVLSVVSLPTSRRSLPAGLAMLVRELTEAALEWRWGQIRVPLVMGGCVKVIPLHPASSILTSTPPTRFLLKIQSLQAHLCDLLLTEGLLKEFISFWLVNLLRISSSTFAQEAVGRL